MRAVKYYPKRIRKVIKKRVKQQGHNWGYFKNKPLGAGFLWGKTPEGRDFWNNILKIYNK